MTDTDAHEDAEQGDSILVLQKAFRLLDLFSPDQPTWEIAQLRAATGFPASTLSRLLNNLVRGGYLLRTGDRFRISLKVLRLARAAQEGLELGTMLAEHVEWLRDESGETSALFIEEGATRICLVVAEARHPLVRRLWAGHSLPLNAGAPGRVLLSYSPSARHAVRAAGLASLTETTVSEWAVLERQMLLTVEQGHAVSRGEWDPEISGIAAPVFRGDGVIAGALAISAPTARMGSDVLPHAVELVVEAARRASTQLGYAGTETFGAFTPEQVRAPSPETPA